MRKVLLTILSIMLTIMIVVFLFVCINQSRFIMNNSKENPSVDGLYPTPTQVDDARNFTDDVPSSEENSISTDLPNNKCFSHAINFENKLYGSLILFEYGSHETRIVQLSSGIQENLGSVLYNMAISPDYDKIAYISENPQILRVIDGYGNILIEKPINSMWKGVISWINDETLLIEDRSDNQALNAKTIKYNLVDDTWVSLDEIPSSFSYAAIQWDNYKSTNMIISPDVERLIFPGPTNHGYPEIILYNNVNSEVVFNKNGIPDLVTPVWSNDGEFVFLALYPKLIDSDGNIVIDNEIDNLPYVGGYDLFQLSKNGQIIDRLTFFSTEHNTDEEKVSLSNNETKLAFWVTKQDNDGESEIINELAILDLETREVTLTCMTITGYDPGPIHWSPDDQYLAVNYLASNVNNGIILVDIENQKLMRFGWKNEEVKGWLKLD